MAQKAWALILVMLAVGMGHDAYDAGCGLSREKGVGLEGEMHGS